MKKRAVVIGILAAAVAVQVGKQRRYVARVAPELRNPLLYMPFSLTNATTLRLLRRVMARPTAAVSGVAVEERTLGQGPRVFVYDPEGRSRPSGVLLWIHGGGRVLGDAVTDHRLCSLLARDAGVLVVSVDHRLAPEDPFPAALDDVMAALVWVHGEAEALGIDPARIAVGGASAGGGLAAEAAQRASDESVPVAFQLLVYPMLDDRTVAPDDAGRGRLVWTAASNRYGWGAYLGHAPGEPETRRYAVAARREELVGLPPAWIGVGDLDLFYAEDVDYATRLRAAGVPVQLDIVPGMYHGADVFMPKPPPSMRAFWQRMADALAQGCRPSHMDLELAQVNIARLRAPLDAEPLRGFVAALDEVNAEAEAAPGFLWRLADDSGNATGIEAFGWDAAGSAGVIVNLSVWASVEDLRTYIYSGRHVEALRRRRQWFHRVDEPTTALWWVPAGHRPTVAEAEERVRHLRRKGPSAYAFTLRDSYGPHDQAGS